MINTNIQKKNGYKKIQMCEKGNFLCERGSFLSKGENKLKNLLDLKLIYTM